jgi:hypothetical protein
MEVTHSFVTLVAIRLHGMDWIQLAQDRDKWRDVVKTVMNLGAL